MQLVDCQYLLVIRDCIIYPNLLLDQTMPRSSSIPKPRSFKPYFYREVEQDRLFSLRSFLAFIYEPNLTAENAWAFLAQILFRISLKEFQDKHEDYYRDMVNYLPLQTLQPVQQEIRQWFEEMIGSISQGKPWSFKPLRAYWWSIAKKEAVNGEHVFWVGPNLPATENERLLVSSLQEIALWDIMYLKCSALPRCEECKHYFLRTDTRPARFCSQPCRWRTYNRLRLEEKPPKTTKKRQKRLRKHKKRVDKRSVKRGNLWAR